MQQKRIMQCSTLNHAMAAYHTAAFSMPILNAIALSHYEFLILLLPAIYA